MSAQALWDKQATLPSEELLEPRGAVVRIFRRFPVTILVVLPYAVLIVPEALIFQNPSTGFILYVLMFPLIGTLVVELLLYARSVLDRKKATKVVLPSYHGRRLFLLARIVSGFGAFAGVLGAVLGGGSIASQVGAVRVSSSLINILGLFQYWNYIGLGLLVACLIYRYCSRRHLLVWVAILIACQAVECYFTAITEPFISYVIFAVIVLLYTGVIGVRHCIVIALTLLIAWPTIFVVRNEIRRSEGVPVSTSIGAFERLRYDLQVTRAEDLGEAVDIGQPDVVAVIRYGLIPRLLDEDRPPLSTGARINVYLGGTSTSSFTFLSVATAYFLEGPFIVIAFYGAWAIFLALLLRGGRRMSPIRLAVFCLAVSGPLAWFATFPDSTIGFLQSLVSFLPILVAIRLCRRRNSARTPGLSPRRMQARVNLR